MADDRGFLDRWSKRKRAAREAERPPEAAAESAPAPPAAPESPGDEPAIDPAELPPLDSIASGADVQAFLAKGVPPALRRAALRRLWSADPVIREFREVADYDWDFNAPGYGALLPADDAKAAAAKLFAAMRRQQAAADASEPTKRPTTGGTHPAPTRPAEPLPDETRADAVPPAGEVPEPAPQPAAAEPSPAPQPRRRRHGSAAPS